MHEIWDDTVLIKMHAIYVENYDRCRYMAA